MKHMHIGKSTIPALGLGTWKANRGEVYGAVREALAIGYKHIDCAPAYENEEEVGAALKEMISSGNVARDALWVTSKLWNNAHIPEDVEPALKKTLIDLQLDHLDLYLIHWPVVFRPEVFFPRDGKDYLSLEQVPTEETWQALEECVKKGLVKHIGVCNFNSKKLTALLDTSEIPPVMNQIEMHPYLQQPEMVELCEQRDVVITAYSPLGSADRPVQLKKENEPSLLQHRIIKEIALRHKITPAQVLIAWALQRKTVVIPKSVNNTRLRENYEAQNVRLDDEALHRMKEMDLGYRYLDASFWEVPGSGYTASSLWND